MLIIIITVIVYSVSSECGGNVQEKQMAIPPWTATEVCWRKYKASDGSWVASGFLATITSLVQEPPVSKATASKVWVPVMVEYFTLCRHSCTVDDFASSQERVSKMRSSVGMGHCHVPCQSSSTWPRNHCDTTWLLFIFSWEAHSVQEFLLCKIIIIVTINILSLLLQWNTINTHTINMQVQFTGNATIPYDATRLMHGHR